MRRLLTVTLIGASLALPATAVAAPVSVRTAKQSIRHWWADKKKPLILWCVVKHDGTICGIRSFLVGQTQGTAGFEDAVLWVSTTRGKRAVDVLRVVLQVTIDAP